MRKVFLCLLVILLIFGAAKTGQAQGFSEFWNNIAYYDTNGEKKNFAATLARFEGKVGLGLGNSPLQLYGAYYGVFSQSPDYWDNSLYSGLGLRFKPFQNYQASGWQNEWIPDVKIFVESLSASYLKDNASAEAAGLAKTDMQYGFDLWHEWNTEGLNLGIPWAELWTKLVYKQTNFGWEDFNNYIFYFQPKVGRYLAKGVGIYLRGDLTYSGKSGASYYFLNIADYGLGIRFEPFKSTTKEEALLHKFNMFAEVIGITYLKEKPTDPNKQVASDVRFGVDFSYGR